MTSEEIPDAQSAARWHVSRFVTRNGQTAYHDLFDTWRDLSQSERIVLDSAFSRAISHTDLSWCELPTEMAKRSLTVLAREGWLVREDEDESAAWRIQKVDIETCTHCNARCGFCPQSSRPKPASVMTDEVFRTILCGIAPYRPQWVSLNHYGEPLLDPHFKRRCQLLQDYGLPLYLFTNATLLDHSSVHFIVQTCTIHGIVFNYPSARPREWAALMGVSERLHRRTTDGIRATAEAFGGRIRILVNGVTDCQRRRAAEVQVAFKNHANIEVVRWDSNDRAGSHSLLTIAPAKNREDRLLGCPRILTHMHFNVAGEAFLCCQDYHQRVVLGSIQRAAPSEIMSGVVATDLRRQIYGIVPAHPSLICRSCDRLRKTRSCE